MSLVQIEQLLTESGLSTEETPELVDVLATLDDLPEAPAPSAALAAVFEGRRAFLAAEGASGPRKRAMAGVLVLALSGVGATGLSAAANTLPGPLQHQVSEFSRNYLPFDLPEPPGRPAQSAPQPADALPGSREDGDTEEASRSAIDRPGAGAPDASTNPAPAGSAAIGQAQPSTAPSSSASPAPAAYAPASKPTPSSSPSGSPSPSPGEDDGQGGKDRDKNKSPQDTGTKPGKSPDKSKPRPPGGGNEIPQPGPGEDPGEDSPAPTPELPIPTLPDLPPTPDLPGDGIDITLD